MTTVTQIIRQAQELLAHSGAAPGTEAERMRLHEAHGTNARIPWTLSSPPGA